MSHVKVKYTAFGQTRLVAPRSYHNMTPEESPEEFLWVEIPEDYYALMSPQLKNKKVAVIDRRDWMKAEIVSS